MELRLFKMVALLLEYGADVERQAPVWDIPWNDCERVPRKVYQRVTAALRKFRMITVVITGSPEGIADGKVLQAARTAVKALHSEIESLDENHDYIAARSATGLA
jgi:L-cystine uptake protein TcyP (sodium:dicarboxylate symporter family)